MQTVASREFTQEAQSAFARLTHDHNPMHMDAMAARRTQAGAPVVHGIHALLWALDHLAASDAHFSQVRELKASFYKWIYVGAVAKLVVLASDETETRAQIRVGNTVVISVVARFGGAAVSAPADVVPRRHETIPTSAKALDLPFEAMAGMSGSVEVVAGSLDPLFPSLVRVLDSERVAAIGALSRIVGMLCPGLHSIFASIALQVREENDAMGALDFSVASTIDRYRLVKMSVAGSGLFGTTEAFMRFPPARQLTMKQVAGEIKAGEFAGVHALIVGGSRGLGELTAKLIAAGGGAVTITYAVGKTEAIAVAEEIEKAGGQCRVIPYNATQPSMPQLADLSVPTHVYYYATTQIFRVKEALFSPATYQDFASIYVDGFYDLCKALSELSTAAVRVFYPSSIAVVERLRDMTEYAMAKSAGEVLCDDMNLYLRGVQVVHKRLPRLATDQTLSVIPVPFADALEVLLPIVREVQGTQ